MFTTGKIPRHEFHFLRKPPPNKSLNDSHFFHLPCSTVYRWEDTKRIFYSFSRKFTTFYGFLMCDWKKNLRQHKESRKVFLFNFLLYTSLMFTWLFGFRCWSCAEVCAIPGSEAIMNAITSFYSVPRQCARFNVI